MIRLLYTVTILELFLGGGGRLIDIGPVTLRMLLFVPCAFVGMYALLARPRITTAQALAVYLMLAYLVVHLGALVNGFIRGADVEDMLKEFQPSLYWLAGPFFALVLDSVVMVRRTATLARVAGVILGISYLAILIGSALGVINFLAIYQRLSETRELTGRGEGLFVYKGFLYLGIAIVFLVATRSRHWKLLTLLISVALVMTLTRGFILASVVSVLLLLRVQASKRAFIAGAVAAVIAVFLVWTYLPSFNTRINDDRSISNGQRISDMIFVADNATPGTFVFGEGFGAPLNGRPNIEITFLWIFWKLGLAGVVFWLAPLALCTYYYASIPRGELYGLACGYYFSVIFVYVQTLTNPYLNNPIGQSFVMAAVFSLRTLARPQEAPASELTGRPLGVRAASVQ